MKTRPDWDTYFMKIACAVSERATCPRASVGAILVDQQNHLLSAGYNGAAPGALSCDEVGCLMHENHCIRAIHAEMNAVGHAANRGVPLLGSRLYTTVHPCPCCAHILLAAGVSEVIFLEHYNVERDQLVQKLLHGMNVRSLDFVSP